MVINLSSTFSLVFIHDNLDFSSSSLLLGFDFREMALALGLSTQTKKIDCDKASM